MNTIDDGVCYFTVKKKTEEQQKNLSLFRTVAVSLSEEKTHKMK